MTTWIVPPTVRATRSRLALLSLALPLLGGCPNTENMTASATETGGTTDQTTGPVDTTGTPDTTGTTGEPDPTTGGTEGATQGGTETAGSTSTGPDTATIGGETDTGDTDTGVIDTDSESESDTDIGPVPPELEMTCNSACDNLIECSPNRPIPKDECVAGCIDAGLGEQACVDASVAFNECLAMMTCEQVAAALGENEFGPCADELEAVDATCENAGICSASIGGNPQGTECSYDVECEGEPTRSLECDQQGCVCKIDGEEVMQCEAAADICEDPESGALSELADSCCGF